MNHELLMPEPQKVLNTLDENIEVLKKISGILSTTADIKKMNLAVGSVNVIFDRIRDFVEDVNEQIAEHERIKSEIQEFCNAWAKQNAEVTI